VQAGVFKSKHLPWRSLLDLTVAYVGYIAVGSLSINLNTVGFTQVVKALISPATLLITSLQMWTMPSMKKITSIVVLTAGVIAATVTDSQVMSNLPGMLVGALFIVVSSAYGILVGSKQKQLNASAQPFN
jgi:solute carrier family 35, member E3